MEVEPRYIILPRFSLMMLALACFFFVSSWPFLLPAPIVEDFPNCVAARSDFEHFAVGAVSQRRLSTVFVTWPDAEKPNKMYWGERQDGHFCSFDVPHVRLSEPSGFLVYANWDGATVSLPYWLMALLWTCVFLRTRGGNTVELADLFSGILVAALVLGSVVAKVSLILIVLLTLSTLGLVFCLCCIGIRLLLKNAVKEPIRGTDFPGIESQREGELG